MTEPLARWLLAIDSSTEQAGVALFDGERLHESSWVAGRTQTASLLREVDHLLDLAGSSIEAVAAIAVATGPGTFNGLRVGMGVAKGLTLATGAVVLGVPTLDAAALPYAEASAAGGPVVTVLAAGRGRLVWAVYADDGGGWGQQRRPRNGTPKELAAELAELPAGALVTGELAPAQEAVLAAVSGVRLPPRPLRVRRPAAVAALAWPRFAAGEADDAAALEPVYVHGRGDGKTGRTTILPVSSSPRLPVSHRRVVRTVVLAAPEC